MPTTESRHAPWPGLVIDMSTRERRRFMARLKALRESHDLSQTALAQRAKLSRAYVARLETGKQEPTLSTMTKLARALKVRPSALLD